MKSKLIERTVENQRKALSHVALPLQSGKRIEAEIGAPKDSHHWLTHVDNACEPIVRSATNEERDGSAFANSLQIASELFVIEWRKNPRSMQVAAALHSREKLLFAIRGGSSEMNAEVVRHERIKLNASRERVAYG